MINPCMSVRNDLLFFLLTASGLAKEKDSVFGTASGALSFGIGSVRSRCFANDSFIILHCIEKINRKIDDIFCKIYAIFTNENACRPKTAGGRSPRVLPPGVGERKKTPLSKKNLKKIPKTS